jgi:hypothetical protein
VFGHWRILTAKPWAEPDPQVATPCPSPFEVNVYSMSKKAIVIAVGLTVLLLFVLASFVTPSIGTG